MLSLNSRFLNHRSEVTLSTATDAPPTHWKQTALWLSPSNCISVDVNDVIEGRIKYQRSADHARGYEIDLDVIISNSLGKKYSFRQSFDLL